MQQIEINVLKPHPRNNEFFDDLSGEEFERLKNSIRDEKIYTDILVSPDMTIISGHQRVRAAKELGFTLVPVKIDTDLQDENSKLRALISNNFGRRKNDPAKDRKALEAYVALRGYKNGGDRKAQVHSGLVVTLDEIAKELNMSKTNLKRALRIERNLTPEMKELLDTGEITKTFAADTLASLSKDEQEKIISKLDVTNKIVQSEMEKYVEEMKSLRLENDKLRNSTSGRMENESLKIENERLERENVILEAQRKSAVEDAEKYKAYSKEYMEVKKNLVHMGLDPNGDYNHFNAGVQLSELNREIRDLLQGRLAPLKYQEYIYAVKDNDILRKNLMNTIDMVNDWRLSMLSYLNDSYMEMPYPEEIYTEEINYMEEN